jgi:hypothetical protein
MYNPFTCPAFSLIVPSVSPKNIVPPKYFDVADPDPSAVGAQSYHHVNAMLFMLTCNSDLDSTMHELEDRFNHKYNYPWVFL